MRRAATAAAALAAMFMSIGMIAPANAAAPMSATSAARVAVVPLTQAAPSANQAETVQYRPRRDRAGRHWHRDRHYRPRHHRPQYQARPRHYGPPPRYREPPRRFTGGSAHVRWCNNRYRSYRAYDNTFQPYGGPRRQCVSPFI